MEPESNLSPKPSGTEPPLLDIQPVKPPRPAAPPPTLPPIKPPAAQPVPVEPVPVRSAPVKSPPVKSPQVESPVPEPSPEKATAAQLSPVEPPANKPISLEPPPPASPPSETPAPAPGTPRRGVIWGVAALGIIVAIICLWPRKQSSAAQAASQQAAPTVAVARVDREDLYNELTIPSDFRPYLQVELHAKVSGYVKQINVDIGDKVKAGQLLATLEVPELKDELDSAKAAQQRAEADYKNAHLIYTRLVGVNIEHSNLVAQQDIDTAEAKDSIAAAALASAKADAGKYQTLVDYTQITAPFDGVVTWRYADPGSLIQAGTASDTQSMPLVRLSDNYRLRLDIPVSVDSVQDIKLGDPVEVRVESITGKTFTGIIARVTQKVDVETRTMITEIDVPNPKLELVPGMYARVVLKVERRPQALAIPTEAISADKNTSVYIVNGDKEIEERPVKLGLETATKYEIVSGLKEGDLVVIAGRSQVKPGQKVEAKITGSLAQP